MGGGIWIDTLEARRVRSVWSTCAFGLDDQVARIRALTEVGGPTAAQAARLLHRATERLHDLVRLVDGLVDSVETGDAVATTDRCLADLGSPLGGDLDGRGDREVRTPYLVEGADPTSRGRALAVRALEDTADPGQVRVDEFQVVRLDDRRWIVVLPGVVDLSRPSLGWDPHHRSVRDLDRAALPSSGSTSTSRNPYARAVHQALVATGVPRGAELLVVGHSFGADTALDLAADPRFNALAAPHRTTGEDGYRVTHVIAAAYHSQPQLARVPTSTEVLVVQNRRDRVVVAEAAAAPFVGLMTSSVATLGALARLDVTAANTHQRSALGSAWGALTGGVRHLVDRADDLSKIALGMAGGRPDVALRGLDGITSLDPGLRTPAPGQVVSVFDGGGSRAGHDQVHYVEHLATTDEPEIEAFLASLDRAGYTEPGVAMAIDVSVP
ncbi:MAG: hypothetical protein ACO225_04875 [Ilumatobacteraceae bacterium]